MTLFRVAHTAWYAIWNYGSTADERQLVFPCDAYILKPDTTVYRAIAVEAPAPTMYSWLCQLRTAPFSYDWIDNQGRPSPDSRDPVLEQLELGQTFMTIFRLVDFEANRHLTIHHRGRLFGEIAVTYLVVPVDPQRCRLLVKVLARYPRWSPVSPFLWAFLPAGDFVMMRRQLRNLARLAARDAAGGPRSMETA